MSKHNFPIFISFLLEILIFCDVPSSTEMDVFDNNMLTECTIKYYTSTKTIWRNIEIF